MRKEFIFKMALVLCATVFFFACSEVDLHVVREEMKQEVPVILNGKLFDNESFVTSTQAAVVVEAFFNKQAGQTALGSGVNTRAAHALGASIETVKEDDNPLMYIINYPEGGFAIVSATRNYYPILAYSEEGSFELSSATGWGGVAVWLGETKEAIKGSEALDDSIKSTMRVAWTSFEPVEINRSESPLRNNVIYERYTAMDNRITELSIQYGLIFNLYALSGVSSFFPDGWRGEELCDFAIANGASPEFSIVGIKEDYNTYQVGPLLTTQWHQGSPFNSECPNGYPAGCVAIAMAQIMKFHQYPTFYNWSNMPNIEFDTITTSSTPALISHIGNAVDMNYGSSSSGTTITKAKNAFQNTYGYSVTKANHNATQVKNELYNNQRPVFMSGFDTNDGGHAWVCDGVKTNITMVNYFVEFQLDSDYSYTTLGYPSVNPSSLLSAGSYQSVYFHMNWGWYDTAPNTWFYNNDVYATTTLNFQSDRENLFVHP
jgi:hypothetical protein